jgi:CheY-like chemotaxis protein
MDVLIVDDEHWIASGLGSFLSSLGHEVQICTDSVSAVDAVSQSTNLDLVIADVAMEQLDGFRIALRVAALLGATPPRTLLMSGNDYIDRMTSMSPTMVIGLIRKPFSFLSLTPLIEFLEQTRTCCPGKLGAFCSARQLGSGLHRRKTDVLCDSGDYSTCPHYETACGRRVQEWISMGRNWQRLPGMQRIHSMDLGGTEKRTVRP